jgi:hypothetical protein
MSPENLELARWMMMVYNDISADIDGEEFVSERVYNLRHLAEKELIGLGLDPQEIYRQWCLGNGYEQQVVMTRDMANINAWMVGTVVEYKQSDYSLTYYFHVDFEGEIGKVWIGGQFLKEWEEDESDG